MNSEALYTRQTTALTRNVSAVFRQVSDPRPQRRDRHTYAEETDAAAPGRVGGSTGGVQAAVGPGRQHRRDRRPGTEAHSHSGAEQLSGSGPTVPQAASAAGVGVHQGECTAS